MNRVFCPPMYSEPHGPIIFLAGPIQGAPDWQFRAITYIQGICDYDIASPRRPHATKLTEDEYFEQVAWEHDHLKLANQNGVVLFWLSNKEFDLPGRAYAQTTRFELAEQMTRAIYGDAKVVVGIDSEFSNGRYIRYTLGKKAPMIPVYDTLEDTCSGAVFFAHTCRK